jgi:uncharacterized protein (DUF486 family)
MPTAFGLSPGVTAGLLLLVSNIFMTIAWYGHLKFKSAPLITVIFISWGIAFIEYCFAVPANRLGSATLTAPQLKGLQEVISLLVFAVFSTTVLGQAVTPRQAVAFALIIIAAFLIVGE